MKALVKETAGPGFVLKNVPVPTIRDNEVLIKVRRAGVAAPTCTSMSGTIGLAGA